MAQVKKLSVAEVYGRIDLKKLFEAGKPVCVMKVGGQAVGTKSGESQYGVWTALIGSFVAIHPETGEESQSSQLFLPEVALIPIQIALAQQGAKAVDFAYAIYVKPSENKKPGAVPYEYTFESMREPATNDPLAAMRHLLLAPPASNDAPAEEAEEQQQPAAKAAGGKRR